MSWKHVEEVDTNGFPVRLNGVDVLDLPNVQGLAHSFLQDDGQGRWLWSLVDYSYLSGSLPLAGTPLTTRGDILTVDATPALARLGKGAAGTYPTWDANDLTVSKVVITQPATSATLTIADGKTLTVNNTLTVAASADGYTVTFPLTVAQTNAITTSNDVSAGGTAILASNAGALTLKSLVATQGLTINSGYKASWKSGATEIGYCMVGDDGIGAITGAFGIIGSAAYSNALNQMFSYYNGATQKIIWALSAVAASNYANLYKTAGTFAGLRIGDATAPTGYLDIVGKFIVDSNGNPTKVNNVVTSFPASQGTANSVLANDGSGNLSWTGFLLTGTTGGTTNFAVTNTKTLTLTATDNFNLTIPATGTATLGIGTTSYVPRWSSANTLGNGIIQDNSTTASIGIAPVANQIFTILTGTATNTALVIQTSDNNSTKNLTEWKSSSGITLSGVLSNGLIFCNLGTDSSNLFAGQFVGNATTTGKYNVVLGYSSGTSLGINASYNVLIGNYCGTSLSTGVNNFGFGSYTFRNLVNGSGNVSIGVSSTYSNISGSNNVAIGTLALSKVLGSCNIAIGSSAGSYQTGSNILLIDNTDRSSAANELIKSIIYGVMAATPEVQTLTVNAVLKVQPQFTVAGINTVTTLDTQGSGANGDGGSILLAGKSSTTATQSMAAFKWLWNNATHASRKADLIATVYDTAEREIWRGRGSGSAPMLGFYGVTPVIQPTGDLFAGMVNLGTNASPLVPYGSMYGDDISQTVTISASATYYEVPGSLSDGGSSTSFTFQSSKQLLCNTAGTYRVTWSMTLQCATANQEVTGAVMVNSTAKVNTEGATKLTTGNDNKLVAGTGIITLSVNDVVKLCVENETGTNDIIVTHATLSLSKLSN